MRRWTVVAPVVAITLSGLVGVAQAQFIGKSSAPLDISAAEQEVIASKCLVTWRGSVEALQGQNRLRADVLSAYSRPEGKGANGQMNCGRTTDKVVADGDVFYVTPTQTARGDHAVYDTGADQMVLTGNVIVVQGNNVARGERLVIKISTNEAHMESDAKGRGAAGRVRGVFYPSKAGQGPAPARPAGG